MTKPERAPNPTRRSAIACTAWGAGLLWEVAGGVPRIARGLGDGAARADSSGFTFAQISDSHIGFDKPANPDPSATLARAIEKIVAASDKPDFMLHTGDITHLSRPAQFDDARNIIAGSRLDVHYVPGEHDVIDEDNGKEYLARYGKDTKGKGWTSFDHKGVHFVGLVNVVDLKAGGMGNLGDEQIAWLAADLAGRSASTPIVVFAHIPLWTVYRDWGWGTDDSERALTLLRRFGSVTVLNGHIHQIFQKVEGNVSFHTARSTAFPQGEPGKAASAGPLAVPADRLRGMLGIASVTVVDAGRPLAIADETLV